MGSVTGKAFGGTPMVQLLVAPCPARRAARCKFCADDSHAGQYYQWSSLEKGSKKGPTEPEKGLDEDEEMLDGWRANQATVTSLFTSSTRRVSSSSLPLATRSSISGLAFNHRAVYPVPSFAHSPWMASASSTFLGIEACSSKRRLLVGDCRHHLLSSVRWTSLLVSSNFNSGSIIVVFVDANGHTGPADQQPMEQQTRTSRLPPDVD